MGNRSSRRSNAAAPSSADSNTAETGVTAEPAVPQDQQFPAATNERPQPEPQPARLGTGGERPPRLTLGRAVRWLLCPALFVAGCWIAAAAPVRLEALLPKPRYNWLLGGLPQAGLASFLDLLPHSRALSWELGRISERLAAVRASSAEAKKALAEAAALLKVPAEQLSTEHLLQLGEHLREFEARRGVASRLAGAFSFVNIVWGAASLGVAVSVGPALAVVCQPLFVVLLAALRQTAAVAQVVTEAVRPAYEPLAYAVCLYIIGAANRYPSDLAQWICATGCLLSLPAFMYSTRLHVKGGGEQRGFAALLNGYLLAVLAPAAIRHSSHVLGFLASAAFFSAVGFSVVPTGLCWYIGFGSREVMLQAATAAGVVLSTLVGLQLAEVDPSLVEPFRLGMTVFGSVTLFLAGLIRVSLFYPHVSYTTYANRADAEAAARVAMRRYYAANAGYLALLGACAAAGAVLGLPPLSNAAVTFCVIWAGEKTTEHAGSRNAWLGVFAGSLGLWQAALWLRSNPGHLASLVAW